jgi:lantibiotic modifying enzyme
MRKTRHYATVIEMFNLPQVCDGADQRARIVRRFAASGALQPVDPSVLAAELSDLMNRDIPYFWFECGDTAIHHASGRLKPDGLSRTPIERAIDMFAQLGERDLERQIAILSDFIDAPMDSMVAGTTRPG